MNGQPIFVTIVYLFTRYGGVIKKDSMPNHDNCMMDERPRIHPTQMITHFHIDLIPVLNGRQIITVTEDRGCRDAPIHNIARRLTNPPVSIKGMLTCF